MTILDTFFLLFESDASKLDKGLDESRKKAKDATEEIKKTDDAARKLGEGIGGALRQLGGVVAGYLAVQTLAQNFWQAVAAADALDETAGRLGVNVEVLSAYGDAVVTTGGNLQSFTASIEALNGGLAAMEVTGKSRVAPFLKELGIDLEAAGNKGKTAVELLPQIAAGLEKMGAQEGAALAKKLGLDPGTIMLLQQGERELNDLLRRQRELGVVTKEQAATAAAFNDQLDDTRHAFRSLWMSVMQSVLPAFTWVIKKFEELATWARENKNFMVGMMIAIGSAIAVFAIPPLLGMAAAAIAAVAPFLTIAAVVAGIGVAFALIYDDIMAFRANNDSLIGQMMQQYPTVRAVIESLGGVFQWVAQVVQDLGAIWLGVWNLLFDNTSRIRSEITLVTDVFKALGALVAGVFLNWIGILDRFLAKFGGIAGVAKSVGGFISGALGSARDALGVSRPVPGLAQGQSSLAAAGASPLASQTSNSVSTRSATRNTNVQVGEVNVQTQATDAAGISKSIGDTLGAQVRQAASNFDDGVVA